MIRRFWLLCLLVTLFLPVTAQRSTSTQRKTASKPTATTVKKATTQKKPTTQKTSTQKTSTQKTSNQRKTTTQQKKQQQKSKGNTSKQPTVKSLQNQKKKLHEDTDAKKKRKAQVEAGVRQGMQALLILNNEINHKRRVIDTIRQDITTLNANISLLNRQMDTLTQELDDRKQRYMKSMRYLHRNRSIQNQMMFVFSADNFNKMYRRLRFTREYATFQRAQGEAVKQKQEQVTQKRQQLAQAKDRMNTLLSRGQQEQVQLEGKQNEQEKQVATLKKEQLTLATIIEQQQRQERELNTRIDKMIAEEVARAKARAEAEARRKAAAEAAKKRQEELARKRAAAEAARKENERRIAQAKAAEERAKAAAREASRKSAQERAAAERRAQEAEQARKRVEKNAREENTAREREIAQVKKSAEDFTVPAADRMLTGGFEQNRGRLPMPITGAYKIVRTFGSNMVEGLKNVQLESKGIHLKGQSGAQARSVFDGEVSAVFNQGGKYIVMVRHGKYISVYCNLTTVSVSTGQRVAARQMLGSLGSDGIMQFQLRNWTQLLNPMRWLGR